MKQKLILTILLGFLIIPIAKSQEMNLLSASKQELKAKLPSKNLQPSSEIVETLTKIEFNLDTKKITISNISNEPILSNEYEIIEVENNLKDAIMNFEVKDINRKDYLMMLGETRLLLMWQDESNIFATSYNIVIPKKEE